MDLFVVGEIVKTRGLRGCLKVLTQMEPQNIITGLEFVYLEDVLGQRKSHDIRTTYSIRQIYISRTERYY